MCAALWKQGGSACRGRGWAEPNRAVSSSVRCRRGGVLPLTQRRCPQSLQSQASDVAYHRASTRINHDLAARVDARDLLEYLFRDPHTDPVSVTKAEGHCRPGSWPRTAALAAPISETVPSRLLATHTAPAPSASAAGLLPTCAREMVRPVRASSFRLLRCRTPARPRSPRATEPTALGCRSREGSSRRSGRRVDLLFERQGRRSPLPTAHHRHETHSRVLGSRAGQGNRLRHALTGWIDPLQGRPGSVLPAPSFPAAARRLPGWPPTRIPDLTTAPGVGSRRRDIVPPLASATHPSRRR